MNSHSERLRLFRKYGYDTPKSREVILSKAGALAGSILEVGTGKGFLSAALARKGFRLTSVDLDKKVQKDAAGYLTSRGVRRRVDLKMMNAEKLTFPARSFDCVVCADFFHHAKNPLRCLKEMLRVAGKKVVLADLNKRGMRTMDRVHHLEGKTHPASTLSIAGAKRLIEKSKWNVKSFRTTHHNVIVAQIKGAGK
ncbi:MAG: class I SAM-dependent methyltransferase [Candidatus Omnitrophota bacterium]|jgi:2-polyprenyl-3-methyl-5-hydroxy-6-metoxy-1,4-benzoquinol methylase